VKVQCWVSCGETCCEKCGMELTGSSPVVLEAPRTCARCKRPITQEPYPRDLMTTFARKNPGTIPEFQGRYRFLSNFYLLPEPLEWEGILYPTTEHAFQAAKSTDPAVRRVIAAAEKDGKPSPAIAKKLGRGVALRPGWEEMKIPIMEELLCLKFAHPALGRLLLETGDAFLIEGNTWGDTFWGVSRGSGRNELGKALMRVRAALKEASTP